MHWVSVTRLITFGKTSEPHPPVWQLHSFLNHLATVVTILISIIVPVSYFTFSALSLATGLITLITIIPMFIIGLCRRGSCFSYTVVEIVWLSVLWVLWLSSGSYAASANNSFGVDSGLGSSCMYLTGGDLLVCIEFKAIAALSFLEWILLMVYTSILIVLNIRAQGRGHSAWSKAVCDDALLLPAEKAVASPAQVFDPPVTVPQPEPSLPSLPPTSTGTTFRGYPEI
ncbi:hypothetical protein BGW80DRAFT_1251105 [Lactifluus volemus]|nr:hypothetical protein BGW80DRAFT_1251105 [Lactifluus volemus]